MKKNADDVYKKSVAAAALLTCFLSVAVLICEIGGYTFLESLLKGGFFVPTFS